MPTVTYSAPTLLEPAAGLELSGKQRFTWQWSGPPLPETYAFDLRIWSEEEERTGQPRRGAVAPTQDTQADVDLQYVPAIQNYGSGGYYWTVVVVKLIPGGSTSIVGEWGEKRSFTYSGDGSTGGPGPRPIDTPVPPPKP
jgi:hypothetical protein